VPRHAHLPPRAGPETSAAQSREEVGEIEIFERVAGVAELAVPAGGRPEILPRPVAAEMIVGRALLGVLQRLVGFADLLEFLLAGGILGHVGVVLLRELAVRLLDLVGAGAAFDAQYLVVVLVFHRLSDSAGRPAVV
jgi:hypothetical protein